MQNNLSEKIFLIPNERKRKERATKRKHKLVQKS